MGMQPASKKRDSHRVGRVTLDVAAALMAGLYLSRVACELRPAMMGRALVGASLLLGLLAAALAVWLLRRTGRPTWPLLLLGAYALWPWTDGRVSFAAGIVSLVALALACMPAPHTSSGEPPAPARNGPVARGFERWPGWLWEAAVGAGGLGLYVATLAPSVQPADAGEFQLVSAVLGIAHPPGYPLYTMLGKLFTLLPLGDPAWRVNLFAAVCAAGTLAVLARTVRQATDSGAAGALAALALGVTPTFWAQGTFANIRSLMALLTVLCLHWLLRYGEARAGRYLVAFALTFGLAVTHHGSLALLALPYLAYLIAVDPRLVIQPRRWLLPVAALLPGVLVLAYLPLRSLMDPPFDPAPIRSVSGFLSHVLALGFRGDMLYYAFQPVLGLRLTILIDILHTELGWGLLAAVLLLGVVLLARRPWRWLLLWGGVALVDGFAAITYRAPQTVEYLLPAYVALALGLGLGLGLALRTWPFRAWPALAGGLVACWALLNGLSALPSFQALHRDDSCRERAVALLQSAPHGALVLSDWNEATPLWYLQQVEGLRRDVTVTYVYPEGSTPNGQVWVRRIQEAVGSRPVLVTDLFPEFSSLPYPLIPQQGAWVVQARPLQAAPAGFSGGGQVLGGRFALSGVRLGQGEVALGKSVDLQVAWRALQPLDRDYSWFVHLEGPGGIAGQSDLTYSADRVTPGEIMVDSYHFTLRPDTPPGGYRLVAGVYYTPEGGNWERLKTADGQDTIELGHVQVLPRAQAPATLHPLSVVWSDGSRLVGVDWDDSVANSRRLYLHWYRPAGAGALALALLPQDGSAPQSLQVPGGPVGGYRTVTLDVNPGAHTFRLLGTDGGFALGPWRRRETALPVVLRAPVPGARYLDLGGEMVLVGARSGPPGSPYPVTLEFLAERPLLNDYAVSVRLDGNGWQAQDDGTPAQGAIPTLKWLAGWRVRDVHRIALPAGASGQARLGLTVYDSSTLEPLPVGDARLAEAGQGLHVTLWQVIIP